MNAELLRERRTALGLTQAALAEKAGVHRNTIKAIEIGHKPFPSTLAAVAAALGLTPAALTEPGGLVVRLAPAALARVEDLHESGLWGRTLEETAEQLVLAALRDLTYRPT